LNIQDKKLTGIDEQSNPGQNSFEFTALSRYSLHYADKY